MQHIVIAPPGALSAAQAFVVPDTRQAIELAVDAFISRLDDMDGDPDLELNGDELDGTGAEDELAPGLHAGPFSGAGCPISDPDDARDEGEPIYCSAGGHGPGCVISDPDVGVDDQGELVNEDGAEQEYPIRPLYGVDQTKGPLNEAAACRAHIRSMLAERAP